MHVYAYWAWYRGFASYVIIFFILTKFIIYIFVIIVVVYRSVDWKEAMSYKGVITHVDSKDIPGENCLENDNEPLQLFATEKVYICVSILRIFVKSSDVWRF